MVKTGFGYRFPYSPSDSEGVHSCCFVKYKSVYAQECYTSEVPPLQPNAWFASLYPCLPARTSGLLKKALTISLFCCCCWLFFFFKGERSQLLGLDAAPMLTRRSCTPALGQDKSGQRVVQEQGRGNRERVPAFSLSPFPSFLLISSARA